MLDRGEHMWWLRRIAVFTFSALLKPCWHSTRVQVETSNLPSLIKVIKKLLLCVLRVVNLIKVYLYEPNID